MIIVRRKVLLTTIYLENQTGWKHFKYLVIKKNPEKSEIPAISKSIFSRGSDQPG